MKLIVVVQIVITIYFLSLLYFIAKRIFYGSPSAIELVRFPIIAASYFGILFGLGLVMPDEDRIEQINKAKLSQEEYIRYCEIEMSTGVWGSLWLTYAVDGESVARRRHAAIIQHDEYTIKSFEVHMQLLNKARKIPEERDAFLFRYQSLHRNINDIIRRGSLVERIKDGSVLVIICLVGQMIVGHVKVKRED